MAETFPRLPGWARSCAMIEISVADGVHRVEDAYTNWYVVEDSGFLTVVDTGHPRSWVSLHELLRQLGRTAQDIAAVVLTHAHFDHVGFAERARKELRVPVYLHEDETFLGANPWSYEHERSRIPYMLRHPRFDVAFLAMTVMGAPFVRGVEETVTYRHGERLEVPGSPTVIHTPGHTFGHSALHLEDRGVLLVGDAVVTYDPYTAAAGPRIIAGAATADREQALVSLDAIRSTGARTLLPGHGDPWRGSV